jgi:hypothetical protein
MDIPLLHILSSAQRLSAPRLPGRWRACPARRARSEAGCSDAEGHGITDGMGGDGLLVTTAQACTGGGGSGIGGSENFVHEEIN